MALKITLKPHERMIIGGAVIRNSEKTSSFQVENTVPVLREKDIMREEDAVSPCSRLYFVIQLMYVDARNIVEYHGTYWKLVRDLVDAVPRTIGIVDQISQQILNEDYYQALKLARKLLAFEKEALSHVRSSARRI